MTFQELEEDQHSDDSNLSGQLARIQLAQELEQWDGLIESSRLPRSIRHEDAVEVTECIADERSEPTWTRAIIGTQESDAQDDGRSEKPLSPLNTLTSLPTSIRRQESICEHDLATAQSTNASSACISIRQHAATFTTSPSTPSR